MASSKPRKKVARFIGVVRSGLLRIVQGNVTEFYTLANVPADYGTAFRICKADDSGAEKADPYHVHFDPETGDSSDCRGFIAHRHCMHRDGLRALIAAGKLS
jgi:hypothetical protein